MQALPDWAYSERLEPGLGPTQVMQAMQLAGYYGAGRCAARAHAAHERASRPPGLVLLLVLPALQGRRACSATGRPRCCPAAHLLPPPIPPPTPVPLPCRLLVLCEAALAPELAALQAGEEEEEEAAELAAALLALADEQGLQQLRDVALAHCEQHLPQACAGRAWRQPSAGQVSHGAREAVGRL